MVKLSVDSVVFSPAVWVDVKLQVKISVGGFEPRILKTRRQVKSATAADDILQELQEKGWDIVKLRRSTRAVPSLKMCFECNEEKPRIFFAKGQRHEAGCCKACTRKIRPEQRRQKLKRRAEFESSFECPMPRPATRAKLRPESSFACPIPRPATRAKLRPVPPDRATKEKTLSRGDKSVVPAQTMQQAPYSRYDFTVLGSIGAPSDQMVYARRGPGIHHPWVRLLQMGEQVRSDGPLVRGDGVMQDYQHSGNWWRRISAADEPPEYVMSALLSSWTSVLWM